MYKIGYLYYGSLYSDNKLNDNIKNGPKIPVRLSGLAFPTKSNIRLTRNLHPLGNLIKSSILINYTDDILETIKKLSNREYYDLDDFEPICYYKLKKDKRGILKIPFFDSYKDIITDYANMIKYLDYKLNKCAKKYELDYIFFISYDHRSNLLNVNHKLENEYFNNELINLILNKSNNQLINNTKKYLKLCDPDTYTLIDYLILTN